MKPYSILLAALALSACGNLSGPNEDQRAAAREKLPGLLEGVARTERATDRVTALRWDVEDMSLAEDVWRWREVEVIAENSAEGAKAVTTITRVAVAPAALGPDVPASAPKGAWGLGLRCAEAACVRRERQRIVVENGERTEEEPVSETVFTHEWLFDDFETRDEATLLVKTALGYPAR